MFPIIIIIIAIDTILVLLKLLLAERLASKSEEIDMIKSVREKRGRGKNERVLYEREKEGKRTWVRGNRQDEKKRRKEGSKKVRGEGN